MSVLLDHAAHHCHAWSSAIRAAACMQDQLSLSDEQAREMRALGGTYRTRLAQLAASRQSALAGLSLLLPHASALGGVGQAGAHRSSGQLAAQLQAAVKAEHDAHAEVVHAVLDKARGCWLAVMGAALCAGGVLLCLGIALMVHDVASTGTHVLSARCCCLQPCDRALAWR